MSVYVVFQHCGAQCVNFDLQNKETADKGRKDADRRGGAGALARPAGANADLFRHRFRSRPRQRLRAAGRSHLAEHRNVLRSGQRGAGADAVAGRRLRRRRHLHAPPGRRPRQVLLAFDVARPQRQPRVLQQRPLASVSEPDRNQAELRAGHVRHRRDQSVGVLFRPVDVARARAPRTIRSRPSTSWPAAPSSRAAARSALRRSAPRQRRRRRAAASTTPPAGC